MRSAPILALFLAGAGPLAPERIVFLGDSITDGHTAPLLLRQALGDGAPRCTNAGVASDTTAAMRRRLERDVLGLHPTRVILSAGINDVLHQVSAADYEREVSLISDRLRREGIDLVLVTPTILGPRHAEAERRLGDYIEGLRRIARKEGYPVAEVHARLRQAREKGRELLEPDQVHLTFEGYRVLVHALLEALGRGEVPVPRELSLVPMDGLIRRWSVRALPEGEWKSLSLPQTGTCSHWWLDQERQRGFAVELAKVAGAGARFAGAAILESEEARDVFLNTGAELASLRLNGSLLWKSEGWTGWHAGKERIPARLKPGTNTLEIESGASFFLSVTDDNGW